MHILLFLAFILSSNAHAILEKNIKDINDKFGGTYYGVKDTKIYTENNCRIEINSNFDDQFVVRVYDYGDKEENAVVFWPSFSTWKQSIKMEDSKRIIIEGSGHRATIHLKTDSKDEIEKVTVSQDIFGLFEIDELTCYPVIIGDGQPKTDPKISDQDRNLINKDSVVPTPKKKNKASEASQQ